MLPLRDEHLLKALLNHLAAAFLSAVLWTRLAGYLFPPQLQSQLSVVFAVGVLAYLLSVALHYIYLAVEESKDAIRREQQARVLAREAELKALKAQINPHFLFNCLHSISALTAVDAAEAREMCIRLSDFLRNTLRLGEKESIPFSEELSLVNTYLAVEQVRFGSRLRVERDIDALCDRCTVPPLLLQPLIENAVKHGIAGLVDGGTIRIRAACSQAMLHIEVDNDFDPDSPAPRKTGLGLANVRSRIATRHGGRGRLDVTVTDSRHRVDILIPCQGANP
jgi:LytS/YehU family sensor histidine kinase